MSNDLDDDYANLVFHRVFLDKTLYEWSMTTWILRHVQKVTVTHSYLTLILRSGRLFNFHNTVKRIYFPCLGTLNEIYCQYTVNSINSDTIFNWEN